MLLQNVSRSPRRTPFAAAALALLAGCADLSTVPTRTPTELRIEQTLVTTTEGNSVSFDLDVLDADGQPMEVPAWAAVRWSVSSATVLSALNDGVRAESPGAATATASVAGLSGTATVRVNPAALKLEIAHVEISQAGNPRPQLDPDKDARVDVFVTGDKVNFFRPSVRMTVMREGAPQQVFTVTRTEDSVPQTFDPDDVSGAWSTVIPGELIQPGTRIIVEADPEATIPRATGSLDRFPESGTFTLDVRSAALQVVIEGAYLTQSVQAFDGSVPLVADRDALLRVFAVGDEETEFRAAVQVSLYSGSAPVYTTTLRRTGAIPVDYDQGDLGTSWNGVIPGSWLTPGVSLVVEADPEGAFSMKEGSRPRFPAAGALALDVRDMPRLSVRMVPIHQTSQGTVGTINASNLSQYTSEVAAMMPVAEIDADVRGTYYTSSTATTSLGWVQILREIDALRAAEGGDRYYYGVLRHPGGENIGGLGYVGWPAAIGYDRMPYATGTFAHELGHNFSLQHAPCGGPERPDPAFPYSTGSIGLFGWDFRTQQIRSPTFYKDLMTYCAPEWISDYSFEKAMNYRDLRDWSRTRAAGGTAARESALLVWGGVVDGEVVLEPAFQLDMAPQLPDGEGDYRIQGFDAAGAEIFSYLFAPRVVDHESGAANFAFAIPARISEPGRLARLRLSGPEGEVIRERSLGVAADAPVGAERRAGGVALSWQTAVPMALIRDRETGEVISFARNGAIVVPDRPIEVIVSDGVGSAPADLPSF